MLKKCISLVLVLTMIGSLFAIIPIHAGAETVWQVSDPLLDSGSGTESDPYRIYSLADLEMFRDSVDLGNTFSDKYFKLMNDITMNEPDMFAYDEYGSITGVAEGKTPYLWNPIGAYYWVTFNGTFDGNEKNIFGIYTSNDNNSDSSYGLFARINNAVVKDLNIIDGYCRGAGYVGAVVSSASNSVISGCYSNCTVIGNWRVGGIAGELSNGSIIECNNSGNVTGTNYSGGIVGEASGVSSGNHVYISNCYNFGDVTGTSCVGGIAGNVVCAYSGDLVSDCCNYGRITGTENVGGIAGHGENVSTCYNTGDVIGGNNVAGILGHATNGGINNSYNTAGITGDNSVGGIVGGLKVSGGHFEVTSSYNTGLLTCKGSYLGGILGYIYSSVSNPYPFNPLLMQNCYYLDSTATINVGGMNNDTSRTGSRTIINVIALDEEQMKNPGNYYGFDFDTVWVMGILGNEYPALQSLMDSYMEFLSLSVFVEAPDGTSVNSGYSVKWFDKNKGKFIGTGKTISGLDKDGAYQYEIILDEELSYVYKQPERQDAVTENGSNIINVQLDKIDTVTVSGKVVDIGNSPLVHATVTFNQVFNDIYNKDTVLDVDENGSFYVEIMNVPTGIIISADGYYSRTRTKNIDGTVDNAIDIGTVALTKLPENKIVLHLTKVNAVLLGQEENATQLLSANSLIFKLYNQSQDLLIEGFTVQYPYIYLEDNAADANDVIVIDITDNAHQMTAPQKTVKLDAQKTASCSVEFIENGKFHIASVDGNEANTLMLFDGSGKFVSSESIYSDYTSKPLTAGSYTAVLIKKTDLLRSVSDISNLAEFGLTENNDYFAKSIVITNGKITEAGNVEVPSLDESKLYYTIPEKTMFTASVNSAAVGRYIVMRCAYEIDEKYDSADEKVLIDLPEGVDFVGSSLTLDGKIAAYSKNGRLIEIVTDKRTGVIRFYTVATEKGQKKADATLSFKQGNSIVTQPIGTATFTAENVKIVLPKKTSNTKVTATGTTMAGSTVIVVDNDVDVGMTKSNKAGSWSLTFDLVEPGNYSYHMIYIIIISESINTMIISDPQLLIYNDQLAEVSNVTMINTAHPDTSLNLVEFVTVFDYLNPRTIVPSYNYWPNYPTFTFKVEFTSGDDTTLSDVYVVTTNSSGDNTYVPVKYDAVTGLWIGTHDYTSAFDIPVSVSVEYTDLFSSALSMTLEHFFGISFYNNRTEEDTILFDMISGGSKYLVAAYPIDKAPSSVPGNENDYDEIIDDTVISGFSVKYNEKLDTTIVICADKYIVMQRDFESDDIASVGVDLNDIASTGRDVTREGLGLNGVPAREIARRVGKMLDDLENGKCDANGDLVNSRTVQAMRANYRNRWIYTGATAAVATMNAVDTINSAGHAGEDFHAAARGIAENRGFFAQALSVVEPVFNIGSAIQGLLGIHEPFLAARDQADANIRELLRLYAQLKLDFLCDPGSLDDSSFALTTCSNSAFVTPKIDPSGYVYEAVPSNRIEGVKVEAYYYDYAVDEFGIAEDEKSEILWDAENYDQVNPLYTDANGQYAWDVPMGQWLVKYSKEGYYDTDSSISSFTDDDGYLPVPPPQTEINIGMVSKSAPVVESINVYENEIRIEFSQYMQIDSVNNDTVTVKKNGNAVRGTITPVNGEYDYEHKNQYASIFTFVPTIAISGKVSVNVNNAVNYAGTKMTFSFAESNQVSIKPESLMVNSEISVAYNSGAMIEIDVLPKEAGAGLSIDVSSSSPSIVSIANSNIVTDENGHANIMLLGNLPGEGEITVSLNGTDITKTVRASVAGVVPVNDRCEKVTANIKSGKTVESGTMIVLSTTTEGAEIYYTLDGTCPCTVDSPSRIRYTEPICITEDTFIIAYAVKDGMQESYTAGFNYFVPAPAVDMLLGDVDGDGTVTIIDATYIQRKLASIPIPFEINETIADTDDDGSITILDATFIQRWLASLPANDNIGKPIG